MVFTRPTSPLVFWICVASFLASISTRIAGISSENQTVLIIGTVCGILSAAIYSACEAYVDGKAVGQDEYICKDCFIDDDKEN